MKCRVHRRPRPRARANICQPLARDKLPAAETSRETHEAQLQQASAIPPLEFLAGGIERLAAITLHIALSMLIWMVVTKRLPLWGYALAIGLHALANLPAGLYQVLGLNMWLTEAVVVVVTACIAFAVWKLYQLRREAPAES